VVVLGVMKVGLENNPDLEGGKWLQFPWIFAESRSKQTTPTFNQLYLPPQRLNGNIT